MAAKPNVRETRSGKPWTPVAGGVTLDVRLTPRGARDAIEGIECRANGHAVLKVRVRAPPFEGAANEALRRLIARALAIAPRRVEIAAGAAARVKRLNIAGDPRALDAALGQLAKGNP
jgi:uncharacterized protein YggU (UPF0235/DUF167 family)